MDYYSATDRNAVPVPAATWLCLAMLRWVKGADREAAAVQESLHVKQSEQASARRHRVE